MQTTPVGGGQPEVVVANAVMNPPPVAPAEDDAEGHLRAWVHQIAVEHDEVALAHLYDATVRRVYSVALRFVRDAHAAEEVVSDVYMQIWNEASHYDSGRGRVLSWMLVCCRSRALDHLRRGDAVLRLCTEGELQLESHADLGEDLLEMVQSCCALREALAAMPAIQRQLIALAYFRGYSHSEIAARERMPLGSVKSQIRTALHKLRVALSDHER